MYKDRFKRFGGEYISDIIQYLKDYLKEDPTVTISVGCDSIQKRRRTIYAITIMLYNIDIRRGAHVVFFRESCPKIRDNHERLFKEAQWVHDIATYLHDELKGSYVRRDLTEIERKRYKFHLLRSDGEYLSVPPHQEQNITRNIPLTSSDAIDWKLVDIHVDFNPFEGTINGKGITRNRSYVAYKSYVPWLRGLGFRVWAKPLGFASTSAADLLLQD